MAKEAFFQSLRRIFALKLEHRQQRKPRGGQDNDLNGINAKPGGTLWAVGSHNDSVGVQRTLILQKLP